MAEHKGLPPQDKVAERAFLGALLIDSDMINEVSGYVNPADFYLDSNGLVYQAMLDLSTRSEPIDIVTVMAELRRLGRADIGDGQDRAEVYLAGLVTSVSNTQYASSYARTIQEASQRRRLISSASTIANMAYDNETGVPDVIDGALNLIHEAAANQRGDRQLSSITDGLPGYLNEMEDRFSNPVDVSGLRTGYGDLDRITNGLKAQELTVVAGRPGMGKTAILMGVATHLTLHNNMCGAVFSLEMSREELRDRMVALAINVDLQSLRRGDLTREKQEQFYEVVGKLSDTRLYINDLPGLSPAEILADARRVDTLERLDFIMVDYLGLIGGASGASRYEQVSKSARELKNLAKYLDIPVITAAQLNRGVEQRADKRPMLHDLRDSGEIEEAADCVLSIYRDGYYDDESLEPNIGEVGILKQRNGPAGGKVKLYWREHSASYHNAEIRSIQL